MAPVPPVAVVCVGKVAGTGLPMPGCARPIEFPCEFEPGVSPCGVTPGTVFDRGGLVVGVPLPVIPTFPVVPVGGCDPAGAACPVTAFSGSGAGNVAGFDGKFPAAGVTG